jgi:hypothetical protein
MLRNENKYILGISKRFLYRFTEGILTIYEIINNCHDRPGIPIPVSYTSQQLHLPHDPPRHIHLLKCLSEKLLHVLSNAKFLYQSFLERQQNFRQRWYLGIQNRLTYEFSHFLFFILVAGHAQPEDLFQPSLHCKLHCIAENEYKIMSDCITHIFHYMQVNGFYQALLPL